MNGSSSELNMTPNNILKSRLTNETSTPDVLNAFFSRRRRRCRRDATRELFEVNDAHKKIIIKTNSPRENAR